MKKNMKYFLAIILSFIIALGVGVISKNNDSFAAEYNGFEYSVSNGKATITGYTGNEVDVVIPSNIKGYPVTKIGNNAFAYCNYLERVEIPDSVTCIELHCFDSCENLKYVKLSKNLTSLSSYFFNGCVSLESIEIPNKITSIGMFTFCDCESLKSIEIPNTVSFISSYAFADCYNLESVNIPNSLTEIGLGIFASCYNLESIEIPNSVNSIGTFAFLECKSLKKIKIPSSVTYIGDRAFQECYNLESIEIPDSVIEIGEAILEDCYNLNKIYVYKDSYAYNYLISEYEPIMVIMQKESTLGITGENYPTTISEGSPFTLKGTISSNYKITYVRVQVLNSSGEAVSTASKTVYPDTYTYSNIDSGIKFGTLSAGNYTYQVIAKDASGTQKTLVNKSFIVKGVSVIKTGVTTNSLNVRKGPSTDYSILGKLSEGTKVQIVEVDSSTGWYKIKYGDGYGYVSYKYVKIDGEEVASTLGITGENYPTTISEGSSFTLTGKISSNYKITSVKVRVLDQYGNAVSTASKTVYPDTYTYSNIDSGIKFGTLSVGNYTYQVIATDESGTTKTLVDKDFVVVKSTVSVGNVTNLKCTSTTSTETLSWTAVSKASGYEIWMYKSSIGDYAKIKTITSGSTTSYKRSSLTSATMYRYKVRAYRTVNGVKYYGNFTDEFITGTKPLTPSITLSSTQKGKIKITWSNISKKTTGYQIYRATSRYGTYTRIATVEDGNIARSYTNSGRTSGKIYYYKVRAYRILDNGKKVYSSYSTVKYIKAK